MRLVTIVIPTKRNGRGIAASRRCHGWSRGDVVEGREQLNLSEWPAGNPARATKRLGSMSEIIGYGDMPPKKYMAIHADARLTDADRKELTDWLDAEAERLKSPVEK